MKMGLLSIWQKIQLPNRYVRQMVKKVHRRMNIIGAEPPRLALKAYWKDDSYLIVSELSFFNSFPEMTKTMVVTKWMFRTLQSILKDFSIEITVAILFRSLRNSLHYRKKSVVSNLILQSTTNRYQILIYHLLKLARLHVNYSWRSVRQQHCFSDVTKTISVFRKYCLPSYHSDFSDARAELFLKGLHFTQAATFQLIFPFLA